tara:strand:- start:5341 stop:6609 length:1269 start_codon:yes stop_codon:yes gene_type:complete
MEKLFSKEQNTSYLNSYLYINIFAILIFMLINPLYALAAVTLLSLSYGRVSHLLIGILFVLSYTLLFSNQVFQQNTDINSYINMYLGTEFSSYKNIFNLYIENLNGHEFLWFYYCKIVGSISGYSKELFIFTTYSLILTLATFIAYLLSENGRYNFILLLFSLVFLEITFFSNIFDLWRTLIASLLFILSLLISNISQSRFLYRLIMYSSAFFHSSMFMLIILYELFLIIMSKKDFQFCNNFYYIKLSLLSIITIAVLTTVATFIPYLSYFGDTFLEGYRRYSELNTNLKFNIKNFLSPTYFLFFCYVIFNYKHIKQYEAFVIYSILVLSAIPYISNDMAMVYYRSGIVPTILMALLATRFLKNLSINYTLFFVVTIFTLRLLTYTYTNSADSFIDIIAKGDFLNPSYGLIASIFYFNPIFQ